MKRVLATMLALAMLALGGSAWAAQPFDRDAFRKAQETGAPILLHVYAPWCPVCRAQEPTVAMLEKEYGGLKVFRVDYDGQKDVVKELGVTTQSTLIAYAGVTETGRSAGVTEPEKIRALVAAATMAIDKKM